MVFLIYVFGNLFKIVIALKVIFIDVMLVNMKSFHFGNSFLSRTYDRRHSIGVCEFYNQNAYYAYLYNSLQHCGYPSYINY